uniref:Terpene synthase like-4 n=1 Tax=Daucus carota subsp. sativus TaxID=79200 RepID=A0A166CHH4_DAUCS
MECFHWSVGYNPNPEFSYGRKVLTAVTTFITTIDDIYDVYGTLEELELLTKLSKRWDVAELDQLPDYVKGELKKGDTPKLIQCYMNDNGVSEDAAREYVKRFLIEIWKEFNEEMQAAESIFSKPFIDVCLNLARITTAIYMYGDGHGAPNAKDIDRSTYLIVDPIPI